MARRAARAARAPAPVGDPFDALGDPNRRAIVELLGSEARSVQEIADALPISRPAVSRHLRLLKRAGLVQEEPIGTRRIYRLHDEGIEAVRTYLERVWVMPACGSRRMPPTRPGHDVDADDRADPAERPNPPRP